MPFDNPNEAGAAPPMVSFGADSFTGNRAFEWNTSLQPVGPSGTSTFSGITTADGKAGYLAVPGLIVALEFSIGAGQVVTAGSTYALQATAGYGTANAGTSVKALEGYNNSGGGSSVQVVLKVEIWKPKG